MQAIILVLVNLYCYAVSAEETCRLDPASIDPPLQVALLIETTILNTHLGWPLFQNETISHLLPELAKKFQKTQFAVTAFGDWFDDNKPHSLEEINNCYKVIIPFTRDEAKVIRSINAIKQVESNGGRGGSYFGLMSTAVDSSLGWNADPQIRKIAILFTEKYALTGMTYPGNRKYPIGDGTDTCSNSLPPHPQFYEIEGALLDKAILVVLVFLNSNDWSLPLYEADFANYYVPFVRYVVPETGSALLVNMKTYNYKNLAGLIVAGISEQLRICTYSDPPAYNTLGL